MENILRAAWPRIRRAIFTEQPEAATLRMME
jgi:hypothetical protein